VKELEAEQTVLLSVVEDLRQNMQIMVSKDTACARARVYAECRAHVNLDTASDLSSF